MKRWNMAGRFALLIAAMALLLTGCGGALNPEGEIAEDQLWLINLAFLMMIAVMVVVFVLFFYVLIRFRKRKGQTGYPKQIEGSHKLEVIWTVVPFILIMILAVFTVSFTFEHEKPVDQKKAINVKVIAHQFWWEFVYTDYDIRTAQDLVLPTDKWVNVEVTAADVIHSFWIPQLAGKIDTNPGVTNFMKFKTGSDADVYRGKCAELCGASHALMDFKTVVKKPEDFNAWVNKMKEPAPAPTTAAELAGEEVFTQTANCIQCHAVTTDTPGAGPNLAGFASRETLAGFRENNDEWLSDWIRNPQEVKPGTTMPAFGHLSDQEIEDLIAYLRTLK